MAILFTEGFDKYASSGDFAMAGWTNNGAWLGLAGGYLGGYAFQCAYAAPCVISNTFFTGSNEPHVFGSIRTHFAESSPTGDWVGFSLNDGGTSQVTVTFNDQGGVQAYTGSTSGASLANVQGGTTVNQWDSFQFEIVISSTAGAIKIYKNGNSASPVLSLSNVNTQGGTANAYVNGLSLIASGQNVATIDDMFLNSASGAAPTTLPGDMHAVQQVAASNVQSQFSSSELTTTANVNNSGAVVSGSYNANTAYFYPLVVPTKAVPGTVGSVSSAMVELPSGFAGNVMVALYADASGVPGALLGSSNAVANPAAGNNTFSFTTAVAVPRSVWFAVLSDTACSINQQGASATLYILSQSYSSGFPATFQGASATTASGYPIVASATLSLDNFLQVSDYVEDGDASYVQSSTVGQEDIYALSSIPAQYTSVSAVTYYALWRKTDIGTRGAALSYAANGSADTTVATVSLGANYQYAQYGTGVDPTSAVWTPTTVNGAHVGVKVAS